MSPSSPESLKFVVLAAEMWCSLLSLTESDADHNIIAFYLQIIQFIQEVKHSLSWRLCAYKHNLNACMHACTQVCKQVWTHTHTDKHADTKLHMWTYKHSCTCSFKNKHSNNMQASTQIFTQHFNLHVRTSTQTHAHSKKKHATYTETCTQTIHLLLRSTLHIRKCDTRERELIQR